MRNKSFVRYFASHLFVINSESLVSYARLTGQKLSLDYAEKNQKLRKRLFVFFSSLCQVYILVRQVQSLFADNVGCIFISHYFSLIEHTVVIQKVGAGVSVIEDSGSPKLTCGFIVRIETNLSCKVLFWLAFLIITAIIKISKKV